MVEIICKEGQFLEGAYDSLDENFTSCDWA